MKRFTRDGPECKDIDMVYKAASDLYTCKRHDDIDHCTVGFSHDKALSARLPLRWDEIRMERFTIGTTSGYSAAYGEFFALEQIGISTRQKLEFHIASNRRIQPQRHNFTVIEILQPTLREH